MSYCGRVLPRLFHISRYKDIPIKKLLKAPVNEQQEMVNRRRDA
jgi:hypothetical protein